MEGLIVTGVMRIADGAVELETSGSEHQTLRHHNMGTTYGDLGIDRLGQRDENGRHIVACATAPELQRLMTFVDAVGADGSLTLTLTYFDEVGRDIGRDGAGRHAFLEVATRVLADVTSSGRPPRRPPPPPRTVCSSRRAIMCGRCPSSSTRGFQAGCS